MTVGAEVVLLGTIADVAFGRSYGDEVDAELVQLGSLTIDVGEVLSGRLVEPGPTVVVEVTLPGRRSPSELMLTLPRERGLFFLRNKGTEVAGWVGLVTPRRSKRSSTDLSAAKVCSVTSMGRSSLQ